MFLYEKGRCGGHGGAPGDAIAALEKTVKNNLV